MDFTRHPFTKHYQRFFGADGLIPWAVLGLQDASRCLHMRCLRHLKGGRVARLQPAMVVEPSDIAS